MNSLIEERNERTRKRKRIKSIMDKAINLSVDDDRQTITLSVSSNVMKMSDHKIRLLDEGYFDSGFFIKKGTLEKFLNGRNEHIRGYELGEDGWQETDVLNLKDDFVGTVNLGHMEFSTFPFIIGEWTKEDLVLVDTENGRNGLDVRLRLDEDSVFVKELKRQPFDIGISSEFYYHVNDEDTEMATEVYGTYTPVIDEVYIFAYGLVGECGNVNSSGLELKGDSMAKDSVNIKLNLENAEEVKEQIDEIKEKLERVEEETKELGVEEIDITVNEEEADAEAPAEEETESDGVPEEVGSEEGTSDDEESEEDVDEEVSDDADDEVEVEEADMSFDGILNEIISLRKENAELKEHIKALKQKNKRLDKKLKSEYTAKEEFLAKTANLSAELFPNEGEAEREAEEEAKKLAQERRYYKGDGIAD